MHSRRYVLLDVRTILRSAYRLIWCYGSRFLLTRRIHLLGVSMPTWAKYNYSNSDELLPILGPIYQSGKLYRNDKKCMADKYLHRVTDQLGLWTNPDLYGVREP
jgi:hypothetical protein